MRLEPLPALADNYIWTLVDAEGAAIVVDPGAAAPVLEASERGLQPSAILLTHHHPDHIGGTQELLRRWPGLPVFAPEDVRIGFDCTRVADGAMVAQAGWRFEVLAVPGHTLSHVAFVGHGVVFSGDTLFSLGCGRLFEGTPGQMLASLDKLAALPPATRVCCGHEYTVANGAFARMVDPANAALAARCAQAGDLRRAGQPTVPSALGEELATNPFLRVDAAAIRAAVGGQLGRDPVDRTETFAVLRRWKDGFRA